MKGPPQEPVASSWTKTFDEIKRFSTDNKFMMFGAGFAACLIAGPPMSRAFQAHHQDADRGLQTAITEASAQLFKSWVPTVFLAGAGMAFDHHLKPRAGPPPLHQIAGRVLPGNQSDRCEVIAGQFTHQRASDKDFPNEPAMHRLQFPASFSPSSKPVVVVSQSNFPRNATKVQSTLDNCIVRGFTRNNDQSWNVFVKCGDGGGTQDDTRGFDFIAVGSQAAAGGKVSPP